jgi:hypothetical protein
VSNHCIHCGEKGHLILQCAQFRADMLKPSPGVCARCGAASTFMPYTIPATGKRPPSVEAVLICPCCSTTACSHKRTAVSA